MQEKNYFLTYILILFGAIISTLQGTRNTLFLFVISGVVMYFTLRNLQTGWKSNLTLKIFLRMILGIVALVLLFGISTVFTGRVSDEYTFMEMLSTYVGSPIKNLELFIKDDMSPNTAFAGETLLQTYKKLYTLTRNNAYNVTSFYNYRWLGTTGLGNVYTMLMPLYSDFGIVGSCIAMFIIGISSQIQYDRLRKGGDRRTIMRRVVFYAYVAFCLSFSFFSNKYFEMVVSVSLIYTMIGYFFINQLIFGDDIILANRRVVFGSKSKGKISR